MKRDPIPNKYILKNISKSDVNLGDLRYRIPAGKMRDLLGKNAHLKFEDILNSRRNGSIKAKLGRSLIEIHSNIISQNPRKAIFKPMDPVTFPQRTKSSIIIDVKDVTDEIKDLILNEEEELISEFEKTNAVDTSAPLTIKDDTKEN